MPRNGSMSASNWWRKVDSDRSTPARNAPIAMDSPPICISSADPSTTSRAAAVMTSRAFDVARIRNSGLSSQIPTTISPASDAMPMPTLIQRDSASPTTVGDMNATSASSGTISRSSNSRIETIFCPRGKAMSPRSPSSCMTIAVEVSTNPAPPMKATGKLKPSARPTPVKAAIATPICRLPRPKICRRIPHR